MHWLGTLHASRGNETPYVENDTKGPGVDLLCQEVLVRPGPPAILPKQL